jgi:cyclase
MPAQAQRNRRDEAQAPPPLEVIPVQGSIYMIPGAGGNITLQIGEDGVLVVDTGLAANGERVLAAIRSVTDKPIRNIINTHVHPDHTGGNELISTSGQNVGFRQGFTSDPFTPTFAYESVLHRMSGVIEDPLEFPPAAWPIDTYFTDHFDMYFNGESIQLRHVPNAHTDGDTMVYFRGSDVISTGDVYVTTTYPLIDVARGGSLQGIIDGLNMLIDLMIPDRNEEGGTLAISGHGGISDEYEVVNFRDMLTIIRDRIVALIDMGMSLEQVKAAQPTSDYDGRYGADSPLWSTEKFIDAVYEEFSR